MPVLRERRVIRHRILQAQLAKPAVGQVEMHFQPSLGANAKAIANDQHPNEKRWINLGTSSVAVVRSQMLVQLAQIEETIDAAQ
jgi:hypothetical protein